MSPTKGRPPRADVSRSKNLSLRFTPKEYELIQRCADMLKMSRTDAILYGMSLIEESQKQK